MLSIESFKTLKLKTFFLHDCGYQQSLTIIHLIETIYFYNKENDPGKRNLAKASDSLPDNNACNQDDASSTNDFAFDKTKSVAKKKLHKRASNPVVYTIS